MFLHYCSYTIITQAPYISKMFLALPSFKLTINLNSCLITLIIVSPVTYESPLASTQWYSCSTLLYSGIFHSPGLPSGSLTTATATTEPPKTMAPLFAALYTGELPLSHCSSIESKVRTTPWLTPLQAWYKPIPIHYSSAKTKLYI